MAGKSGSAKIEGHSKFGHALNLKPYLTDSLQQKHDHMITRLFAVIVHVGKNSHSGHYLAYVRNVSKNEWWKMDDSRISLVSEAEVLSAEAYMLFYRVVEHPYAKELSAQVKHLNDLYAKQQEEEAKRSKENKMAIDSSTTTSSHNKQNDKNDSAASSGPAASVKNNPRKRKAPDYTCGEDWAKRKARIPETAMTSLRFIEKQVSEYVQFTPTFLKMLHEQAKRPNAKVGHGPSSGICCTYM
jgi:hypothetical protein